MNEVTESASGSATRITGFGVLGPLEVWSGRQLLDVGRRRQRMVLGLLLLEAGRWFPADRLIELMWAEETPPRTARNAVQVCVSRLRSLLGEDVPLTSAGGGYRLDVNPDLVDACRFRTAVTRAGGAVGEHAAEILRGALGLWRGPVLADTFDDEMRSRLCGGLEETRLAALESRVDAELGLGRHSELVGELTDLVTAHPARERLVYQLMLALYRDGQSSRALDVFHDVRARLSAELGIDPGPKLRDLEVAILRNSADLLLPPAPTLGAALLPVPAQLPAAVRGFTGRTGETRWLDGFLEEQDSHPLPGRVAVLAGSGGIGKTALAVRWAHRSVCHFPEGQLFADLRGYSPMPAAPPIEVLVRFLRALGVEAEQIPHDEEAAAALYRTCLSGRRVLIILDNAADASQIRPLLPGSATCMTIVTSRNRLSGLVVRDGALQLELSTLSPADSLALLAGMAGDYRLEADPDGAAALAELCGGLPLALCIAAANLVEQPHRPLADYAAALRTGNRVAALTVAGDGHAALTTAFDLSYQRLDTSAQRMFRLLSLVPGADVTVPAAAALTGISTAGAERLLRTLVTTHLCEETARGRFGSHDLLREYAAARSRAQDPEADRIAAADRLFSWYLHTADAAGRIVAPRTVRLPLPPRGGEVAETLFAGRPEALGWLDAERANLMAAIQHAAVHGPRHLAWLLPDALDGYLGQQGHAVDRFTAARTGLEAAISAGDKPAKTAAHIILGRAHHAVGEDAEAHAQYASALATAEQLAWPDATATALVGLGAIAGSAGPLESAAGYFTQALSIRRTAGIPAGQADLLANLGRACVDLGELDRAVDCCTEAITIYQQEGSPRESHGWWCLGCARHALGDLRGARDGFTRARRLDHQLGTLSNEARDLAELARVTIDAGRTGEGRDLAAQAVTMAQEAADPEIECFARISLAEADRRGMQPLAAADGYRDVLGLAEARNIRLLEGPALVGLGFTSLSLGDAQSAGQAAQRALDVCKETGHRLIRTQALRALSGSQALEGRLDEAVSSAREALAACRETGQRLEQVRVLLTLSRLSQHCQRLETARCQWRSAVTLAAELRAAEASEPPPG